MIFEFDFLIWKFYFHLAICTIHFEIFSQFVYWLSILNLIFLYQKFKIEIEISNWIHKIGGIFFITNNNEIRVKVNGGYLVAGRNSDPNYDGIYIVFETDEGIVIDIVTTEAKSEYNKELIDVYCYENVYTEDFTKKFTLDTKEIYNALDI